MLPHGGHHLPLHSCNVGMHIHAGYAPLLGLQAGHLLGCTPPLINPSLVIV
jgi:hypothetical protein